MVIENDAGGPSKGQSDGWVWGGAQELSSEEVTFEQRPGGSEGWRLDKIWGKSFQMEGTRYAKALK